MAVLGVGKRNVIAIIIAGWTTITVALNFILLKKMDLAAEQVKPSQDQIASMHESYMRNLLTLRTDLITRARFIDWQISELAMTAGDAISIANAAHDAAVPEYGEEVAFDDLTTAEIDSIRRMEGIKTYGRAWAESRLEARLDSADRVWDEIRRSAGLE